jgi:hypothetical protein
LQPTAQHLKLVQLSGQKRAWACVQILLADKFLQDQQPTPDLFFVTVKVVSHWVPFSPVMA